MARTGITQEQVKTAADRVRARGEAVTIQRVRDAMGGTGSFTTINKYLDEWRAGAIAASVPEADQVPSAVEQMGATLTRELWRAATAEMQKELVTVREAAARQAAEMAAKADEAMAEVRRLEVEAEDAAKETLELKERAFGLNQQLIFAKEKETEAEGKLKEAGDQAREMAVRIAKLEEYGRSFERERKMFESSRERLVELEKTTAAAGAAVTELRSQIEQEKERTKAAAEEKAKAAAELEKERALRHEREKEAVAAAAASSELRERLAAELRRSEAAQARLAELTEKRR